LESTFFTDSEKIKNNLLSNLSKLSSETLGWVATIAFHLTTIPTLLSLVAGVNDRVPTTEMTLFIWLGLMTIMLRSIIQKDYVNIFINSVGFFIQACLFSLVLFK